MALRSPERLTLFAFVAIVLIGGTNFVAVRFSNREIPPFWGASLRFAPAAMLLFAFTAAQKLPLPQGRALAGTLIYGVLGFGASYAFSYWALQRVPASLAAVVLASTPLLTFLLALLQGQEQFRRRPLASGAIALIGIGVIFRGSVGADIPLPSLLAMIAAALCVAESTIVVKNYPKTHPVSTNAVAMAAGVAVLIVLSLMLEEPWHVPSRVSTWVALAYLSLLGSSAAVLLFLYLLKRWTASAVSYQFVLIPIVAIIVAALLEHAPAPPSLLFGGGLVLVSVYAGVINQPPPLDDGPKPWA